MRTTTRSIGFLLLLLISSITASAQTLKLMTYNIHHGADKKEINTLEAMGKFIKDSGADLIGLQEVDSMCNRSGRVDQMKRLSEITGMYYAFVRHYAYDGGAYGLGILSRYPVSDLRNERITLLPKNEARPTLAFLSVRISLPKRKKEILFGTVHFALNAPGRMVQAEEVLAVTKDSRIPVILTGDLNALPGTEEILKLETRFTETGSPEALTFSADKPEKKIDYIMVSNPNLRKVTARKVYYDVLLSDHLPVVSTVVVK
jgi:endonuclease/exonuclease/phosphatase family metal-dependent hydrolase